MTLPSSHDPDQDIETAPDCQRATGHNIAVDKPKLPTRGKRHRIAPKQPINPLRKSLFILLIGGICYTIFGFSILPQLITRLVPGILEKKLNRSVTIGSAQVNPFRFTLILKNGIIGAEKNNVEDKVDPLFSFGRLKLELQPQNIFLGKPLLRSLHGNSVFLHAVRDKDLSLNLQKIYTTVTGAPTFNLRDFTNTAQQIDIKLSDARLLFEDRPSQTIHTIDQIRFRLPQNSTTTDRPYFSASINGSPVEFGNTMGHSTDGKQTFGLTLKEINLPSYLNYLPPPFPKMLSKGMADVDLSITTITTNDGFKFEITGTSVARDIWLNDGKENHNKIDTATFTFSYNPAEKHIIFHKLILDKPELHLSRDKAGQFFFPAKQTFNTQQQAQKIQLENVVIKNGKVVFIDQNIDGGFATSFNDINLSIEQNPQGKSSSYALNCITSRQTRIVSQGLINHDSWQIHGLLILNDLPLSAINSYLNSQQGLSISSGILTKLETSFTLAPAEQTKLVSLTNTSTNIKNLSLNFQGKEILNIPETTINKAGYVSVSRTLSLGDIHIQQGRLHLDPALPISSAATTSTAWKINTLAITNSVLYLRDYPFQNKPQAIVIPSLNLTALASDPNKKGTIQGEVSFLKTATLKASGSVQMNPFQMTLDTTIKKVALVDIPAPLLSWLHPPLLDGVLSGQGQIIVPQPSFNGNLTIKNLKLRYGTRHNLLNVKRLHVQDGLYTPTTLKIAKISIDQLHTGVSTSRKNIFNAGDFFNTTESTGEKKILLPTIGVIQIKNSQVSLHNNEIKPSFSYSVTNIKGSFTDINPSENKPTTIELTALGPEEAVFKLNGTSRFFTDNFAATFDISLIGLPIYKFKPFIEPITDFGLQGGLFSLKVNLREHNGMMEGQTDLDIRHLTLNGEEMGNKYFPDIVALLTDNNQHIRINIPFTGNTTDPSYTFQSAYAKKLRELLLAFTVSPYSAVREYYTDTPPSQIVFIPGTNTLAPHQDAILETMQTILDNRPLLHITIAGFSGSSEDRATLLQQKKEFQDKQEKAQAVTTGDLVAKNYGTEGASRSIGIPTQVLPPKKIRLTKQELQVLAISRSEKIKRILISEYKIDGTRLHLDATPTIVPESETGIKGHRVDLIPSSKP